jgi:2-polyprenyl-6-methoxyphenol hydroxylase-like FAD-dependent oxidoreductase
VVGGGLSGICAALSAARNGVQTALVHDRPMLGGHSSSEVRLVPEFNNWWAQWAKETGIIEELYAIDRQRNHEPWVEGTVNVLWDLTLLEAVMGEPNLTLYMNTSVRDAVVNDGRIEAVEAAQFGTEKDFRLSGELFVDATGTGTLGYLAGADFYWGREGKAAYDEPLQPDEPDDETMGATMYYRARDVQRPVPFVPPAWAATYASDDDLGSTRMHLWIECGHYWQEVGMPYHLIHDNEELRREQLRQVLGVWDHIKNRGDHDAEKYALDWFAWTPYRRDNRRLLGDHVLTQHDVQAATQFDDRVAFGAWPIDMHVPGGILKAPEPTLNAELLAEGLNPYSIPLRSLYSRNVENLFVAGRPISCSYVAFASTRILPTGAMTGQAVGAAASICLAHGETPRAIAEKRARDVQQLLLKQDHYIPFVTNEDPGDLARTATVTASSSSPFVCPPVNYHEPLAVPVGQIFPVSAGRIDAIELDLKSSSAKTKAVTIRLLEASSVWDFDGREMATSSATLEPRHSGWATFAVGVDVEPGCLYCVQIGPVDDVEWRGYLEMLRSPDVYAAMMSAAHIGWWETMKQLQAAPTAIPPGVSVAKRWDLYAGTYFGGRRWSPMLMAPGRFSPRALSMRIAPEVAPYGPENVISGVARPERWTNIWMSDPDQAMPQELKLAWSAPRTMNSAYLTFDTDLNRMPDHPLYVAPECVREYVLSVRVDGAWVDVAAETGNFQRRRAHRFERVAADAVRLTVHATNGAPSARVYEVRIYDEES